jgi:coenzyme PQQ biosynthesis probable peptidase PqqF
MTLSLVGPQSLEELKALAEQFAADLPAGDKVAQAASIPLAVKSYQQVAERRGNLMFAFDALPESSGEALAFLCHWLNSAKPGGLLAHLQQQNLADGLKAAPVYHFASQALLHLEFSAASESLNAIGELVLDWLSFFAQQDWVPLQKEYAALLQRQQQVSGALQLARLDSEALEVGLSDSGVKALTQILSEIGTVDNFSDHWSLPAANPFLRASEPLANAGLIRGQTSAHRGLRTFAQDRSRGRRERSPMQFSQALPDNTDEGAVYLRWQVEVAASADLQSRLQRSLRQTQQDAREAGVDLSFSDAGNQWLLKLTGLQEPMPSVLEHALKSLTQVDADSPRSEPQAPLNPIRQLLETLPEQTLESAKTGDDAQHLWTTSRWDGLALGLNQQTQSAMGLALSRIPGIADNQLPAPTTITAQKHWRHIDTASSEYALLLFCPTASRSLADEAAWRLLAQLCQTPFYQRLRVELQLGYAVFSALRQIHGQTAMLFGVQSPNTPPVELLGHIRQFFESLPMLVEKNDESSFEQQRQSLADQFDDANLSSKDAAELLWQARLAGHSSDYLEQLIAAIGQLDRQTLLSAAQRLSNAEGGWLCLASDPAPETSWQAAN